MTDRQETRLEIADGIAILTLYRPDKLNAFTGRMMHEIISAFDETDANDDVKVVIVTGAGRAFCAGADLSASVMHDFTASSGGHPQAAALAFLVFLLAYTPCVATLATQVRQIGRRWTLVGVVMQLSVAYLVAVLVFQIGRLFL